MRTKLVIAIIETLKKQVGNRHKNAKGLQDAQGTPGRPGAGAPGALGTARRANTVRRKLGKASLALLAFGESLSRLKVAYFKHRKLDMYGFVSYGWL